MAFGPDRELDVLNSACCRVKGVELVCGDVLDGNFGSLVGEVVTMPSGEVLPLVVVAEQVLPVMRAMLAPMRAALRRLQDEARARWHALPSFEPQL